MIKAGMESLGGINFRNGFILELGDVYRKLSKLGSMYKKGTMSNGERDDEFDIIAKQFNSLTVKYFNLPCRLRNSSTFGVMAIFNVDEFSTTFNIRNSDVKHTIKQLKSFKSYLLNNEITIDYKTYKVYGLPSGTTFPLMVNIAVTSEITETDFATIILHEIGHVISLLEMYGNTTKSIVSMMDDFITNNSQIKQISKFKLSSKNIDSEAGVVAKIYDHIDKDVLSVKLSDGRGYDTTDIEFEADAFVARFGLGGDLAATLNKIGGTFEVSYLDAFTLTILVNIISVILNMLVLAFLFSGATPFSILMGALVIRTMTLAIQTINKQNNRNPSSAIHGTMDIRFKKIRLSMIGVLRKSGLNKSDQKLLLHQIDTIDSEIKALEASGINGIISSLVDNELSSNNNLHDNLALTVEGLVNNDLYLSSSKFKAGLESAGYVGRTDILVSQLESSYTDLSNRSIIKSFKDATSIFSDISDYIYDRTGIPTAIYPASLFGSPIGCIPFNMVNQSSLSGIGTKMDTKYSVVSILNDNATENLLKDLKNGLKITLDKKTNRITGLDKKRHKSVMFLEFGRDIFGLTQKHSNIAPTPLESTAIVLHEIGHLFTYIEAMTKSLHTNTMLQEALLKYNDDVHDVRTLTYEDKMDKAYNDYTTISGSMTSLIKSSAIQMILMAESMFGLFAAGSPVTVMLNAPDTSLGDYSTIKTDSEVLADDFATMFGVGPELATGLRKMVTFNSENPLETILATYSQLTISLLKAFTSMLILGDKKSTDLGKFIATNLTFTTQVWFVGFIARVLFNSSSPYENLPDRLRDIKRSLVKVLRNEKTSKADKKDIVKQLDLISEQILKSKKAGYDTLLLSTLIPNINGGVTTKVSKLYIDSIAGLINNDLHISTNRFNSGLESGLNQVLYHNSVSLGSQGFYRSNDILKLAGRAKKDIINTFNKYDIEVEITKNKDNVMFDIYTKFKSRINTGVTTFTIVPSDKMESVILLTTDIDKVAWQLKNTYIEMYNVDVIKITDGLSVYICEMQHLDGLTSKQNKINEKIGKTLRKLYDEYGRNDYTAQLEAIRSIKTLPEALKEQYAQLHIFIDSLSDEARSNVWLDLHGGNTMVNNDGIMILTDPMVVSTSLASKSINTTELDLSLLSTKNPTLQNMNKFVYHIGAKGYKNIRSIEQQGKKGYDSQAFKMLGKERYASYIKHISAFIHEFNCEDKLRHEVEGFKVWEEKNLYRYTIDLLANKNNIDSISVHSTPQENKYHDEYWDKYIKEVNENILKQFGSLDTPEALKEYDIKRKVYKDGLKVYLEDTFGIKERMTVDEYLESPYISDWQTDKYVKQNVKHGSKEQYASTIPHVYIYVNKPLEFTKSEKLC